MFEWFTKLFEEETTPVADPLSINSTDSLSVLENSKGAYPAPSQFGLFSFGSSSTLSSDSFHDLTSNVDTQLSKYQEKKSVTPDAYAQRMQDMLRLLEFPQDIRVNIVTVNKISIIFENRRQATEYLDKLKAFLEPIKDYIPLGVEDLDYIKDSRSPYYRLYISHTVSLEIMVTRLEEEKSTSPFIKSLVSLDNTERGAGLKSPEDDFLTLSSKHTLSSEDERTTLFSVNSSGTLHDSEDDSGTELSAHGFFLSSTSSSEYTELEEEDPIARRLQHIMELSDFSPNIRVSIVEDNSIRFTFNSKDQCIDYIEKLAALFSPIEDIPFEFPIDADPSTPQHSPLYTLDVSYPASLVSLEMIVTTLEAKANNPAEPPSSGPLACFHL